MNPTPPPNLPLAVRPVKSSDTVIPGSYTEVRANQRQRADEPGLIHFWTLLRRRKGILIVIAFLGALAGALATLAQTRMYQAHTSLELHDPNSTAPDYAASDAYLQTQTKILQSQSLADRALEKMKRSGQLAPDYRVNRLSAWIRTLGLREGGPADEATRFARALSGSLAVRTAGQSRIVELTAESTSPRAAADFLNSLAAEFIQQNLDTTSQNISASVTREVDEFRAKLESSEERLRTFERQAGLSAGSETGSAAGEKLKQLQQELATATGDRAAKQSRYEVARNSAPDALPEGLANLPMRETLTKLAELRRQLVELSSKYTPKHYRVITVHDQIVALEATLQQEKAAMLDQTRRGYEEAVRREQQLTEAAAAQGQLINRGADKEVQHNALKREVESNRQLYERILAKTKETTVPAAIRAGSTRIVDPAGVPEKPFKPSMPQNVVLGLLGGLILGMVFVVSREQADRVIQEPGEAAGYFNLPELGVIPSAKLNVAGRIARSVKRRSESSAVEREGAMPAADREEFIISGKSPFNFVDSIRSTLLSIVYSGNAVDQRRVLVFSSSNPGEGKTTVAANLAIAFAGLNRKVLLIDGDLRRPRIHEIFGLPNLVGLNDLLEADGPHGGRDSGVIHESPVKNLFILTSGASTTESAILVYESRLRDLIEQFRGEFDTIILDTPPLLQIPDARVIGRMADAMILVVRAGKTKRDAVAACCTRLGEDGIPLLGIILNDWNPRTAATGYYGSYAGPYTDAPSTRSEKAAGGRSHEWPGDSGS